MISGAQERSAVRAENVRVDAVLDGKADRLMLGHVERIVAAADNPPGSGMRAQQPELLRVVGDAVEEQLPEPLSR